MNDTHLHQIVGARFRHRREALGLTQEEVAEKLRMLRTSVTNIEAGRQRPPLHVLFNLCEVLDCEITDIVPLRAEADKWQQMANEERTKTTSRALLSELKGMQRRIAELEAALADKAE